MGDSGLSIADALALKGNDGDDGMFGGNSMMMFLLFILLLGGNGGLGGIGAGSSTYQGEVTRAEMQDGFNNQEVLSELHGIERSLADGFYNSSMATVQGFNGVGKDIAALGYQMSQCCCETNRSLDSIRYEAAKNTCEIITAGNANAQLIVDTIKSGEIQALRDKVTDYQIAASNAAQTATLINAINPAPIPAYPTCNPHVPYNGYGCGSC